MFETQIGEQASLGLLKINYKNIEKRLLEDLKCAPKICLQEIKVLLPEILKIRCKLVKEW